MKRLFLPKKITLGEVPHWIGEHAFFVTVVSLFLSMAILLALFLSFVSARGAKEEVSPTLKFSEQQFERVVKEWERREKLFQNAASLQTRDIFQSALTTK